MKKGMILVLLAVVIMTSFAQDSDNSGLKALVNHHAARNFVSGSIARSDLDAIINAGIRAPSARNQQPWYFTVVQNPDLAQKIVPQSQDGNVLIVVSSFGDGKTNGSQIFDCALATENIYLAAQVLGYGSRIYTGPMDTINSRFKAELGLPSGHSAVALVRVGRVQAGVDAVSAASSRKRANDMVNYK
ncbi:MAG: nitroreductase family protein [Treponema sp.]|nr:nitroreductase family protein [Treponema sp.]